MRVRGGVRIEGHLDVRGFGAALSGRPLVAVRGDHVVLVQASTAPLPFARRVSRLAGLLHSAGGGYFDAIPAHAGVTRGVYICA